jgi:hypothetical protein
MSSIKNNKENKKKDKNNILYYRNNILNDIGNYELYIFNNINNIYFNNEQNDNLLESKLNDFIFEQLINKKINKNKHTFNKETTFVNNFNSDYSFESNDDYKKLLIGSKINNYPINNNIFKDISFKSLTNSSESKNETHENMKKNKKFNSKIYNGLILNKNNLNAKIYNIKSYNITQNTNYFLDNNKYKNEEYSIYKKNIKRNISESILKNDQKINDKKHINKIHSIINNKKNNYIIKKSIEKKNLCISNESWCKKNNNNNIFNKKIFYYTNNGKMAKKSQLKISINDTYLNKEKKVNKKTLSNSSIDKIIDNNNENNRKNLKLILYNSSLKIKNSKEKSRKRNSSSIRKTKIKSKSTPKEMNNNFPFNNSSIINHKKNKKIIFDNNSLSLPKKTINSYSHKNKAQDKSLKKTSKKIFVPKIIININKNNNKKKGNKKNKKINVNNYFNIDNLFLKDYIYKCSINSFINNNNKSIINLKSSLYNTISKTKRNSISMKNNKILYNNLANTNRIHKNKIIFDKEKKFFKNKKN